MKESFKVGEYVYMKTKKILKKMMDEDGRIDGITMTLPSIEKLYGRRVKIISHSSSDEDYRIRENGALYSWYIPARALRRARCNEN